MGISETTIALFGGNFDPIHNGHLHLAESAISDFNCRVRLVPNGSPPHRPQSLTPWQHRFRMCQLTTAHNPHILVGDDEAPSASGYPHYTLNTLESLKRDYPRVLLLIGSDQFLKFKTWYQWQAIFSIAHVVVAHRIGYDIDRATHVEYKFRYMNKDEIAANEAGGIHLWRCQPPALSSTSLRQLFKKGKIATAINHMHKNTVDYPKAHRLYAAS